jgi:hypothetical protein
MQLVSHGRLNECVVKKQSGSCREMTLMIVDHGYFFKFLNDILFLLSRRTVVGFI